MGRFSLRRGPCGVCAQRRQTPRHEPPVATDSRLVRRWRFVWAPALSLSPRTRARGGRRDDWNSSNSQILTEFRPDTLRRHKKKAPRPGRSALIFRILLERGYFPFFGAFFSSFFAFFFIRISFPDWADAGRRRQPPAVHFIYERSSLESRDFDIQSEKILYLGVAPA